MHPRSSSTHAPAIAGAYAFKLVSDRDTLLGTLLVPPGIEQELRRHHAVRFMLRLPPPTVADLVDHANCAIRVDVVTIWLDTRRGDTVRLWNATPEAIEQVPGFHFMPGAAYLRSLIDGG